MGGRAIAAAVAPAWLDELSFGAGPPWHGMGTRALAAGDWLLEDEHRAAELAQKVRLLRDHHEVVVASTGEPAVVAAAVEAADLVATATGRRLDADVAPLVAAARAVQEDLCLLICHDDGWRLDAGVVCFPSMWRIADKIGRPLTAVHEPVPAYASELAARVDQFLDRLRPERPVRRRNWLVHTRPDLHQPDPPAAAESPPSVPTGLWLRSERQTLRRLPATGATVFTIRTQQVPLGVVATRPDVAAAMAFAVRSWSDDLVRYRGAGSWREPVLAWLDDVAGRPV